MTTTSMLEAMEQAARTAGAFMHSSIERNSTEKTNAKDFVTVADIKSQAILKRELLGAFPEIVILSEEDDEQARAAMYTPDFTGFILDPIDGTYNFKRDMRESAISIGYIEKGESLIGVVYDPYRDELYTAKKGEGAYRNTVPIHVSSIETLEGASIATSNSYDDQAMSYNLHRHLAIYEATGIMPWTSCPGSGVLILCWVACGRIDSYHHNGLKPWDNAAAFLIIREAGGIVWNLQGKEAPFTTNNINAGTPFIVKKLQPIFDTLPEELRE